MNNISNINKPKTTLRYDSPSGFINTGKLIPPFSPLKDGFGFLGVLAEDLKTEKLQCAICGEWFENLSSHIRQKHKMKNMDEYKKRFGLLQNTALISKKYRIMHSETMARMRKDKNFIKKSIKANVFKNNPKKYSKQNKGKKIWRPEYQNKLGVCDLQVAEKVKSLAIKLNYTPRLFELEKHYGRPFIGLIRNRYGNYLNLIRDLGLKKPIPAGSNARKYSKNFYLQKGIESIKKNKPFEPTTIFTKNELHSLATYWGSRGKWKTAVIRAILTKK